jgi:hypothetical protein
MGLNDRQIDRYSRQIIVAGGIAQERLLSARIAVAGDADDVGPVLDYLAGAGVGRINLHLTGDAAACERLKAHARDLNPDVTAEAGVPIREKFTSALLLLIGNSDAIAMAAQLVTATCNSPAIVGRLDWPARITILPPSRIDAANELKLFAPFSHRDGNGDLVAMVSATEVLKLLIDEKSPSNTSIIEFDGYRSRPASRPIHADHRGEPA